MAYVQGVLGEVKICILIPIHNEAVTIGSLVQALKAKNLDVFVVDDGSQDASGAIAQKEGALVLANKIKQGKGRSLQKGFATILQQDYDGVILMDGDGQHDVDDIEKFLKKAHEDKRSIIAGNRMGNSKNMPLLRYLTNRGMSSLISWVCRQHIPDTQCGYRYIPCEILRQISFECGDFEIESEILIKSSRAGFHVHSIPVKTIYCNEKSKINPFKDTIRFFAYFIKEMGSRNDTRE